VSIELYYEESHTSYMSKTNQHSKADTITKRWVWLVILPLGGLSNAPVVNFNEKVYPHCFYQFARAWFTWTCQILFSRRVSI